ncbi:4-hydroxy-3-methylbut-2-enyl diphosphate reductase [Amycolatopsis taiwanensis]|uniref:4-hydroxy-3-methylbut-2-enyl diphosphate reductase n=1 Tax=Amycolatopsis taiwanensis TaxID=342230 RepID=A0A9W6R4R4_9PSEU|nr:4-hydroxy-3-methylbut-2-enyl diphosphate reductase [Amycolatopsis taiwanensis]GLY69446.1 hypothetical protein Atai01_60650 [Amycolatopsis taiwanensis]
MFTAAQSIIAANHPGSPDPGVVLVADVLLWPNRPAIPCPAAVLLEGELQRRGARTKRGHLHVDAEDREAVTLRTVLPGIGGLGAAVSLPTGRVTEAVCGAMAACLAVAGPARRVLLAAPRSFCAGVERAIELVERLLSERGGPVYVRKPVVHNAHVAAELRSRGVVFVEELTEVPHGATVVFSSHGVSPAVRVAARRRGLEVIDATCPLVERLHAEARRAAEEGGTVIVVGHAGNEEVDGILGEAPGRIALVQSVEEARHVPVADPSRVSYVIQTTLSVHETAEVVDALRARFPMLKGPSSEDVCYATTNRQNAVRVIAVESELVLVVGSKSSPNAHQLVEIARRSGSAAHLVEDPRDIQPHWLTEVRTIGVTAGASTPPPLVNSVIRALGGLGPVTVEKRESVRETSGSPQPSAVG